MPMTEDSLLLASRSPRRRELLDQIGVSYQVAAADVDESVLPGESPEDYVVRLAQHKACVVFAQYGERLPALAADTTVVLGNQILGKPVDRVDGMRMLLALSGRTHRVLTAVALRHRSGMPYFLSVSEVTFATLTPQLCEQYWNTGEPADKAGGYAVQGLGALFITGISGSYTGIMGLPLYETGQLLGHAGICHTLRPGKL